MLDAAADKPDGEKRALAAPPTTYLSSYNPRYCGAASSYKKHAFPASSIVAPTFAAPPQSYAVLEVDFGKQMLTGGYPFVKTVQHESSGSSQARN